MNVTLFQKFDDIEPFFWTKEQINNISLYKNDSTEDRYFTIDGVNYRWKFVNEVNKSDLKFEFEDGINLVVIQNDYNRHNSKYFFEKLNSLKGTNKIVYIVFGKLVEDYWGFIDCINDSFLKRISDVDNVKVIWDVAFYELKNFIFSPKVHIQSYFLNTMHGGIDTYYWGRDIFLKYPKQYRIGFHFNKIQGIVRHKIVNQLKDYKNSNFFYTINSNCSYSSENKELGNYKSTTYDSRLLSETDIGVNKGWYTIQFFELGVKSQMEIVYETFTYPDGDLTKHLIKWNEKTIKHLYLGKPFIHCDPIAHKLMYENEIKPYRTLYTDELWEIYENWDINVKGDFSYIEKLIENIKWLSEMDETEWSERIGEAMKIAEWNKNKVDELIFDTSLMDIVKSDIY